VEEADEWEQILQKIGKIKSGTFRLPFLTLNRDVRQIEMDLSQGKWADHEVLVAICRDITYRVEIENQNMSSGFLLQPLPTWLRSLTRA